MKSDMPSYSLGNKMKQNIEVDESMHLMSRSRLKSDVDDQQLITMCEVAIQAWSNIGHANADNEDGAVDQLCEAALALTSSLADQKAESLSELAAKARLWRCIAPDDTFDSDAQSPDEKFLAGIMNDIERLVQS